MHDALDVLEACAFGLFVAGITGLLLLQFIGG